MVPYPIMNITHTYIINNLYFVHIIKYNLDILPEGQTQIPLIKRMSLKNERNIQAKEKKKGSG